MPWRPSFGGEESVFEMNMNVRTRPVGPFKDEASALAFLRDRLVVTLKPRAIWQFGSRARGDNDEDSDFDLLVVLPDGLPEEAYAPDRVAEPVVGCGLAYDIVPCSWTEFCKDCDAPNTLVNRVVTEGRPIYRDRILRKSDSTE